LAGNKINSRTFTTAMPNSKSIFVFIVVLLLIVGLFFVLKTYKELSGEVIVINDEQGVLDAKEVVKDNLDKLDKEVEELRTLVS
tara:strand:+ start:968 stop:1219 length:252 start_codon:yes stop_codon:yes gene_type:complete